MYEGLASYFLPTGVLEYFAVTDFCEVPTQNTEVLYTTELHIYLDERDNRTADMRGFGGRWHVQRTTEIGT